MTYIYSASGLPPGLSLVGNTVSGTPTVAGTYTVTFTVGDGLTTQQQAVDLAITSAPVPVPFWQLILSAEDGVVWSDSAIEQLQASAESGVYWGDSALIQPAPPTAIADAGVYWLDSAVEAIAETGVYWLDSTASFATPSSSSGSYWGDSVEVVGEDDTGYLLSLRFNGANGSTTFIDSSPAARTITAFGGAQISTAQSVEGGSSLLLNGSTDYLALAWNTPLVGDFTIDVNIRPTTLIGDREIFSIRSAGNIFNLLFELDAGAGGQVRASLRNDSGSSYFDYNTSVPVVVNAWTNVKLVIAGTTATTLINNVVRGSATFSGIRQQGLTIAQVGILTPTLAGVERYFAGYIDTLRISSP